MIAPKTERDMNPQSCSIRELGDTTPLPSKKGEEASAPARGGPERAFRFGHDWIAFRETLAVELGALANSIVAHAVLGLGVFGEGLPKRAFGNTLEVVSRHLGRNEGEHGQHQEAEKQPGDQLDNRFQISHAYVTVDRPAPSPTAGRSAAPNNADHQRWGRSAPPGPYHRPIRYRGSASTAASSSCGGGS